jgi:GT2 family glycosyltransferase
MAASSRIGAVVVNFNAGQTLDRCLDSLGAETLAGVRVVDNDSQDGSQTKVPNDWLVQNDENIGFARAVNVGMSHLGDDIDLALVLNPDAWLLPDALDKMTCALQSMPGAAVVGPLILDSSGRPTISARRFPGWSIDLVERFRLSRLFPAETRRKLIQGPLIPQGGGPFAVDWLAGGCLLIDLAAWKAIGSLSEDFFLYGEELDWCWRAAKAGYSRLYVPEARVQHVGGVSAATTMTEATTNTMVRDGVRRACSRNMRKASYLAWRATQTLW